MTLIDQEKVSPNSSIQSYLLVGGMPRSGTTAFVEFLSDTFEMEALPETHFLNIVDADGKFHYDRVPSAISNRNELIDVLKISEKQKSTNFVTFISDFSDTLGVRSDIVIEKTPSHVMSMRRVSNSPRIVKFVIVRRCSDVCKSLSRVDWNTASPLRNVARWARYASRTRKMAQEGQVAVILHEDLLNNREELGERLE